MDRMFDGRNAIVYGGGGGLALDERAVEEHVARVAGTAGSVDVSFNLVTRGDAQGTPLVEMTADDLLRAVTTGLHANFLTARAAARRMIVQGASPGCRCCRGHRGCATWPRWRHSSPPTALAGSPGR